MNLHAGIHRAILCSFYETFTVLEIRLTYLKYLVRIHANLSHKWHTENIELVYS